MTPPPHSPWLFGDTPAALARGFFHAHLGWLFGRDRTNAARFTPDLLADRDIVRISALFPALTVVSLAAPALLGGLLTMSWWGAATALFWAGLVRVAVLHHVTWSINSICHMIGERPFAAQGKATNFWPWRSCRWASPGTTCTTPTPPAPATASDPGEIDITARVIWLLEKLGWAHDVRWPTPTRLARLAPHR